MAQCMECGWVDSGGNGSYTTCETCRRAGRSPEARRRAAGLPPESFVAETRTVYTPRPGQPPGEVRFTVPKNRGEPTDPVLDRFLERLRPLVELPPEALRPGRAKMKTHLAAQVVDKGDHLELVDIKTGKVLKKIERTPRTRFEREDVI